MRVGKSVPVCEKPTVLCEHIIFANTGYNLPTYFEIASELQLILQKQEMKHVFKIFL